MTNISCIGVCIIGCLGATSADTKIGQTWKPTRVPSRLAALRSAKSAESVKQRNRQQKNLCSVLKLDVACLCSFCELAKMTERLVLTVRKMKIMHFKVIR